MWLEVIGGWLDKACHDNHLDVQFQSLMELVMSSFVIPQSVGMSPELHVSRQGGLQ